MACANGNTSKGEFKRRHAPLFDFRLEVYPSHATRSPRLGKNRALNREIDHPRNGHGVAVVVRQVAVFHPNILRVAQLACVLARVHVSLVSPNVAVKKA